GARREGRGGAPRARSDGKDKRRYYRPARHPIKERSMPDDATPVAGAAAATQPALQVKGLDHVVLRVADMDRAIAFYEQVLGLHVERRLEEIGLVQLRAGTALIDLVPKTDRDAGRNMDHYAVRIAEIDVPALTAHLQRHGI